MLAPILSRDLPIRVNFIQLSTTSTLLHPPVVLLPLLLQVQALGQPTHNLIDCNDIPLTGGGVVSSVINLFSPSSSSGGGSSNKAQTAVNDTSLDTMTTGAWKALGVAQGMQGGVTTCFPANGAEVIAAVTGTTCTVIMLTRNYFDSYVINQEMMVTGRKVIIGNPLTLPLLNTTGSERLFHGKNTQDHSHLLPPPHYYYYDATKEGGLCCLRLAHFACRMDYSLTTTRRCALIVCLFGVSGGGWLS